MDQIKAHPVALAQSERLTEVYQATLEESSQLQNCLQISYTNVMNLWPHLEDIKQNSTLMSATVLGLGETWIDLNTTVDLPDFQGIFENVRDGQGLAAYTKGQMKTLQASEDGLSAIKVHGHSIEVIFLYLSTGVPWAKVKKILQTWINPKNPTVVMGDMNWHWDRESTRPMKVFLEEEGFSQLSKRSTHDKGNCLDHCYINREVLKLGPHHFETESSYFSDHDILTLYFPAINLVS